MKNKFAIITLFVSLLASSAAMSKEEKNVNNFAENKAKIIANLNQEKSAIETEISCVNSSKEIEAAKKCREQRKATMEKLKQQRLAEKKARLQDQIKKIDEESSKVGTKSPKENE